MRIAFWSIFVSTFAFLILGLTTDGTDFESRAEHFLPGAVSLPLSRWFFGLAVVTSIVLSLMTLHPACRDRSYSKAATASICFTLFFVFTQGF